MSRLPRIVLPGHPQLIYQCSHRAQAIFRHERDYHFYLESLHNAVQRYGGDVHAYTLMADRVHLLITPYAEDSLARILQQVGRSFVRYLNSVYDRSGSLWDGRYKAVIVDSEHYLLACYRYVELEPLRSHAVVHPEDFPWSSYRAHALGESSLLIRDHALYRALGPTPERRSEAYCALVHTPLEASTLDAIQKATATDWLLGSNRFREVLVAALEQRSATLPVTQARDRMAELLEEE